MVKAVLVLERHVEAVRATAGYAAVALAVTLMVVARATEPAAEDMDSERQARRAGDRLFPILALILTTRKLIQMDLIRQHG